MTDIYAPPQVGPATPSHGEPASDHRKISEREDLVAAVELLFFAYRDFTGEADAVLAEFGFGRAHHRVLHFVNRHPGLRVADLLDILKITKQSLARVLKQLVDQGYILQKAGPEDRRERLLYLTAKGRELANKLLALQCARVAAALAEAGDESGAVTRRFLAGMIAKRERPRIEKLIFGPDGRA
jgi:DNA-binding MarR family transcriptional regulator